VSLLLQTDHSAVRVITLNRPEKMNAYNVELHNALNKAILDADKDKYHTRFWRYFSPDYF